jgi:hypothetical protein
LIEFRQELREKKNGKSQEVQKTPKFTPDEVLAYTESVSDWESEVDRIRYVEKSKVPGLIVYIDWLVSRQLETKILFAC